jgi:hypothetical protein
MKQSFLKVYILIAVSFFFLFQESRAQSEYEKRGDRGYLGSIGFFTSSETGGAVLAFGYSPYGYWDAGFTLEKGGSGRTADGIFSPNFTYYILKQEDAPRAPSLGISASFSRYSLTESYTFPVSVGADSRDSTLTNTATYSFLTVMGTAHRHLGSWRNFDFLPFLGAGFAVSSKEWRFVWRGGVSVTMPIRKNMTLVINPTLQREPYLTTFILSAGVLF